MEKDQDEMLLEDFLQVMLCETETEEEDDDVVITEEPLVDTSNTESDSDVDALHAMWERDVTTIKDQKNYFQSRNESIIWFKSPVELKGVQITSDDTDTSEFGVQECARHVQSPFEAFSLFFDDQVLDLIVSCTNIYIKRTGRKYERSRDCKETTNDEISALMGILLFSGGLKTPHYNIKDMWAQDGTGLDIFRLTMSFSRFRFLVRCIRFDDFEQRRSTMKLDKLTPVKEIMRVVQNNFKRAFVPGKTVSIYEHILPFRGKCSFKTFSKSKPRKIGVKLQSMSDTKTFYFLSCEIMTEKKRGIHRSSETSSVESTSRLVESIKRTNRLVIADYCFTSLPIAHELGQHGLSFVGTCSKRDKDVPREFHRSRRAVKSSLYGFTDVFTLISYVPKRKHSQVLLSNRKEDRNIATSSTEPNIVSVINSSNSNLEEFRNYFENSKTGTKTKRWPLLIFFHMLSMAARNAEIILADNCCRENLTGLDFMKQLSLSLMKKRMESRSGCVHIPRELRKRIRLSINAVPHQAPEEGRTRGRCYVCSRKKDIKSRQRCYICHSFICKEHSIVTCNDCFQNGVA